MPDFDNNFLKISMEILDAAKKSEFYSNEISEMLNRHHLNLTHLDVKVRRILGLKRTLGLFESSPSIESDSANTSSILLLNFRFYLS